MYIDGGNPLKRKILLDTEHCVPDSGTADYRGKLLLLRPSALAEEYQQPQFQYFYATGGFGCDPKGIGSKVYGYFLIDGAKDEFRRGHFMGIADPDKLPKWAAERLQQIEAPKMKIRVFQIDHDKDTDRIAFECADKAVRDGKVNSALYRQVYGGTVNCRNLEDVFALCNENHPPGYCGESMSVSNVIEICEGEYKGFYYCDSVGFQPVEFDVSQTDHAEMLTCLIMEPGKEPYVAEIRDCLEAKQSVVGGHIEPIYFDETSGALAFCDEEFLYKSYAPNRMVGNVVVQGNLLVIGDGRNEYGEGIEVSLDSDQIERFSNMFHYPLVDITGQHEEAEMEQDFDITQA